MKAIVIGSGIGGLAASIRLKHMGYDVHVFESNAYAGGKLHAFSTKGYRFDFGPSLFTMPNLVNELFELFDEKASDWFQYKRKEVVCNYFWEDGRTFSVSADKDVFIKEAEKEFDTTGDALKKYLERNKEKYDLTARIFLEKSLHKLQTYLSVQTVKSLMQLQKLDLSATLDQVNRTYFKDKRLVQLFNRYATYNGSSPYSTPGIMSMIPHLEMQEGTFFPLKGMHDISQSIFRFAQEKGVEFHFDEGVTKIIHDEKQVTGIETKKGVYHSDVVLSNSDVFSTYHRLLKGINTSKRVLNQERSSSAVIFYWGIRAAFPQLDLHNIVFSNNYKEEFTKIFDEEDIYSDPTVYINITGKEKKDDAPEGCENWFVMINAPGNVGQDWDELIKQARRNVMTKLNKQFNIDLEQFIETEYIVDPRAIETMTGSHQGSLYGTSSNSKMAAFLRHPNFSRQFENLLFCGGSVHPGGGIPLCLLSAKIAIEQLNQQP